MQPPYQQPPQPQPFRTPQFAGWGVLAGGAVIIIGSLLPWAVLPLGLSLSAISGDGLLTLLIGLVVMAFGLVAGLGKAPELMLFFGAVAALGAAALAGWEIVQLLEVLRDSGNERIGPLGQLGPGLPVIGIGSLFAVVAAMIGGLARPKG